MGYQVILDYLVSAIAGGLLFLVILSFNAKNIENKRSYRYDIYAFSSISTTMDIINDDFNRIGYCANRFNVVTPYITAANDTAITFRTDTLGSRYSIGNGTVDLISYRLGGYNTNTPNRNDRFLEKRINGGPWFMVSSDVTEFNLSYYRYNKNNFNDKIATPVANLNTIIRVDLKIGIVNGTTKYSSGTADSVTIFRNSLSYELR